MPQSDDSRFRKLFRRLTGWLRRNPRKEPEPPIDPYSYVTAPKKPRPSTRSGAAVAELPEVIRFRRDRTSIAGRQQIHLWLRRDQRLVLYLATQQLFEESLHALKNGRPRMRVIAGTA
jgi:hypothetical protein